MPLTGNGLDMERLALRGGYFGHGVGAGLFGLRLASFRDFHAPSVGFRPALAPSRQMPGGHGFRDGTGVKGGCFLPGARWGNNSAPVRQVGDERGAGVLFV